MFDPNYNNNKDLNFGNQSPISKYSNFSSSNNELDDDIINNQTKSRKGDIYMSNPSFRNISRNPNIKKNNSNINLEYKNKRFSSLHNNIMDLVLFFNSSLNNNTNISSLNILSKLKSLNDNQKENNNNFIDVNKQISNEEILKKTAFGEDPQGNDNIIHSLPINKNNLNDNSFSKISNKKLYKTDNNILDGKKTELNNSNFSNSGIKIVQFNNIMIRSNNPNTSFNNNKIKYSYNFNNNKYV